MKVQDVHASVIRNSAAAVNVAWTIEGARSRVLQSFNTGCNPQRFGGNTRGAIRVLPRTGYEENLSELRNHASD